MTATETVVVTSAGRSVEVDREALDAAGWIPAHAAEQVCTLTHCEDEAAHDQQPDVAEIIERWHNEHHAGAYRFCYSQPCKDVREVSE